MSTNDTAATPMNDVFYEHLNEYEMRGDGGDYTPTEFERGLLEDFGWGLVEELKRSGHMVALSAPAPAEPRDGEAFPALGDAPMIARALRELDWSNASIGHRIVAMGAAEALETLSAPRPARPDAGEAVAADDLAPTAWNAALQVPTEPFELATMVLTRGRLAAIIRTVQRAHPPAASAETARVAASAAATERADAISQNLETPNWRPSRAHMEDARNALRKAAAALAAPEVQS